MAGTSFIYLFLQDLNHGSSFNRWPVPVWQFCQLRTWTMAVPSIHNLYQHCFCVWWRPEPWLFFQLMTCTRIILWFTENLNLGSSLNQWPVPIRQFSQLRTWTLAVLPLDNLYQYGSSVNWGPEPCLFSRLVICTNTAVLLFEDLIFNVKCFWGSDFFSLGPLRLMLNPQQQNLVIEWIEVKHPN